MKKIIMAIMLACLLAVGVLPQTAWAETADISYLENELKDVRRQLTAYDLDNVRMNTFVAEWDIQRRELAQTYTQLQQFYTKGKTINTINLIKKTISLGMDTYETAKDALSIGTATALKGSVKKLGNWAGEKAFSEMRKEIGEAGGANHYSIVVTPFATEVGKSLPELEQLADFIDMDIKESQEWLKKNENIDLTEEKPLWLSEKAEEASREDATILARWRVILEKTQTAQDRLAGVIRQGDQAADTMQTKLRNSENEHANVIASLKNRERELTLRLDAAMNQQAQQQTQKLHAAASKDALAIPPFSEVPPAAKQTEVAKFIEAQYPPLGNAVMLATKKYKETVKEAAGLRDGGINTVNPLWARRFDDTLTYSPEQIKMHLNFAQLENHIDAATGIVTLIADARPALSEAAALFGKAADTVQNEAVRLRSIEQLADLARQYSVKWTFAPLDFDFTSMTEAIYEKEKIERMLEWLDEVESTANNTIAIAAPLLEKEKAEAKRQKELKEQQQREEQKRQEEAERQQIAEQTKQSPEYRFRQLEQKVADNAQAWFALEPREFFLQTMVAKEEARSLAVNDLAAQADALIKRLNDLEERYRTSMQAVEPQKTASEPIASGNEASGASPQIASTTVEPPTPPAQPELKPEVKPQAPIAKPPAVKTHPQLPADYQQQVRETLAILAAAYQQENLLGFMQLVSPDFLGDDFLLDRALRRDFRAFDNISLRFSINSINIDARGRAQVLVNYNRSVASQRDGKVYTDRGLTQFAFNWEKNKVKLYDMRYPIIFGVSEASQLATGEVRSAENEKILTVNRRGDTSVLPYNEARTASEQSGVKRGNGIRLQFSYMPEIVQGWSFADNRRTHPNSYHTIEGDFTFTTQWLNLAPGTSYRQLSATDVSDVTEVPDPAIYPYTTGPELPGSPDVLPEGVGKVYALKLSSGKYAVIKFVSYIHLNEFVFDYKYQPSGSRTF